MNAPAPASAGIDWTAVAAGAGASLLVGISASYLMSPMYMKLGLGYGTIIALGLVTSVIADVVGGAIAGFMAKRRGALHGALAMLGAMAAGLAYSAVMLSRQGHLGAFASVAWWAQWLGFTVLGLVVGTVAGLVAARIAAKQPP